jgi:hypothetical protein
MTIIQGLIASISKGASAPSGPAQGGDGSAYSVDNNGATYTLTPTVNGMGNSGTANPGDVITWTITSAASQSGRTIIWWVDNNNVPVNTWVEQPYLNGTDNAGSVILDGNGTGSFSLTVANPVPIHNLFRMYISDQLYNGWLTHGYIGV